MMKRIFLLAIVASLLFNGYAKKTESFIRVENGKFIRNRIPYYYIGTNFWYGAILASEGNGGNRTRLDKELDSLKSIGIDNLRILVGADGKSGTSSKVEPTLQTAPGVYNDTILAGLDYLMMQLQKRRMVAVIYLNNSWEWSGGYGQYLEWSGHGKAPIPFVDGWPAYMNYVKQFLKSDSAKTLFSNHLRNIITRVNRYTHVKYIDDPTIMSWQIGNEPRAFSDENKPLLAQWILQVSKQIKLLDKNHLVSTGSEGMWGCEQDMKLFEKIHSYPTIDYMNIHIWPYNWGWAKADSLQCDLEFSKQQTKEYIDAHLVVAKKYKKPLVLEEFGYPRDSFCFKKSSPTHARDAYYDFIFHLVIQNKLNGGLLAGCNFWGWGGQATPSSNHLYWQRGDDYTGDPAQEQQGLNSVFITDSTVAIIRAAENLLK